jgi:hypothetical protein
MVPGIDPFEGNRVVSADIPGRVEERKDFGAARRLIMQQPPNSQLLPPWVTNVCSIHSARVGQRAVAGRTWRLFRERRRPGADPKPFLWTASADQILEKVIPTGHAVPRAATAVGTRWTDLTTSCSSPDAGLRAPARWASPRLAHPLGAPGPRLCHPPGALHGLHLARRPRRRAESYHRRRSGRQFLAGRQSWPVVSPGWKSPGPVLNPAQASSRAGPQPSPGVKPGRSSILAHPGWRRLQEELAYCQGAVENVAQ